jgi:hypothetical protein
MSRPSRRYTCIILDIKVDAVPLAAGDEGPEPGVVLGRGVVAGEEPVFALMLSFA